MTEKQFEFREVNCGAIIPKVYDNKKQQYANLFECVDWLNDLHEENMQLKQQREELFYRERDTKNEWRELKKENEQLKQKVNFYKDFQKDARELEKENEQLKSENGDMRRLINNISLQRDEFLRGARENANRVGKLKKEKEFWKSDACSLSNLNSILSNELSIAQEQGYEPSKPYKEYISSVIKASDLQEWGHYEVINNDLSDNKK